MSELLWVAVPGGTVQPDGAVLRVLVVPRLSGLADTADLAAYGFADWPARLADARLHVERADEPPADPKEPLPAGAELAIVRVDPPVGIGPAWSEVFPPGHMVRAHQPPEPYAPPRVDLSATQSAVIRGVYTDASAAPDQPPNLTGLQDPSLVPAPPVEQTRQRGAPNVADPDFHRVVAMLREHPRVLAGLGLVIELRLTDPAGLGEGGVIRVRCTLPQLTHPVESRSPWTSYVFSAASHGRFVAASPAGSDLDAGMLRIDSGQWPIETFDVTGAVDRLRGESARQRIGAVTTGPAASLPPLRSAGLSLMRADREEPLRRRAAGGAQNTRPDADPDTLVLDAEHLLLGYRVDVRSTVTGWQSLMRRLAAYTATTQDPALAPKFPEEGQVKANAVTVEGSRQVRDLDSKEQRPPLRADEVVVRWDGWSLTCPKPGTAAARGAPGRRGLPYLAWSFAPVGLPTLRFGRTYRMRVRLADAAGGGLGPDEPEPTEQQSTEVFYGRHDPVPHPVLVPPAEGVAPGPGDQVDVLVIRSDPLTGRGLADFAGSFPANDRRALLPPSASWLLVEQHGRFGDHQDPVEPGEPDEVTLAGWLARALQPETVLPGEAYSWLPDPLAEGAAITVRAEPGTPRPGETTHEGWTVPNGAWPDLPAKTIALEEPTAQHPQRLDWTDDHRRGVVRLRPGEQLSVEVTSTIVSTDTGLLAMEHWLNTPVHRPGDRITPAARPSVESIADVMQQVREGRHPMVSPALVLRLVHAVPHPVTTPRGTITANRAEGDTLAELVPSKAEPAEPGEPSPLVELGVHVPSTGQVELRASWQEVRDDDIPQQVSDLLIQVATLPPDATRLPMLRHEFGDTRHRFVEYAVTAVSRYRDYFPPSDDPAAFATPPLRTTVDVLSAARPPEPAVLSVAPAFRWSGTPVTQGWTDVTRVRDGGVVRVELARPWNVSGGGEMLAVLLGQDGPTQTTVRRDPIWRTPLPPALGAAAFRDPALAPDTLPLPEVGADVLVVPYRAHFIPDGDLPGHWFADVELPGVADTSYGAFISLVLARLQPDSLPGLHLSRAVRAEPVQLLPTRTMHATRTADLVHVTLSGLQPDAADDPQFLDPGGPRRTRVDVHLETLPAQAGQPDITATGEQLTVGWRRVGTTSGRIDEELALQIPAGDQPMRLVVREVEGLAGGGGPGAGEMGERVVYLDVLPIR